MAECITCGSFTKYNGGLCLSCFGKKSTATTATTTTTQKVEAPVPTKGNDFHYNMIKGRIAETLIQELYLSLGYNVFRYGMENTIPGIMELLKGVRSDVALEIRRMPDFVMQNPKTKEVYFIEVKFRASGEFKLRDLDKNYPYTNAYIVLVSKKHIKCITVDELKEGKEISSTSSNYLGNRKEFDLDKEVIKQYCDFAIKFFENV